MSKRMNPLLLMMMLAAALLAGCGGAPTPQISPAATVSATVSATASAPACPTPSADQATLCGQVNGAAEIWPEQAVKVFAAPFTSDGSGHGFYLLEPVSHPHSELLEGGYFQLAEVPPGEYVLIVGPEAGDARAWLGEDGRPRTVMAEAGQALELGVIEVR